MCGTKPPADPTNPTVDPVVPVDPTAPVTDPSQCSNLSTEESAACFQKLNGIVE